MADHSCRDINCYSDSDHDCCGGPGCEDCSRLRRRRMVFPKCDCLIPSQCCHHITALRAKLAELELEMLNILSMTAPEPRGGQHVGPRLYQHPTTHRFAKDYLKPWADRLRVLRTE
jgi:hypothetical protein